MALRGIAGNSKSPNAVSSFNFILSPAVLVNKSLTFLELLELGPARLLLRPTQTLLDLQEPTFQHFDTPAQ